MRIVSWNIRAGGGVRAEGITRQIEEWQPDLVHLCEFRGTPASTTIAQALAAGGLVHQVSAASERVPARNSVFVASRQPLRKVHLHGEPKAAGRWLGIEVAGERPLFVGAMHIPNEHTKLKWPYMEALLAMAKRWRRGPAVFLGDTNSGRPGIDEESPVFGPRYERWFDEMAAAGFRDAFRQFASEAREFTWYSPHGRNGFRLDEALVNRPLWPAVREVRHVWAGHDGEGRREVLSDHAALILDLADVAPTRPQRASET